MIFTMDLSYFKNLLGVLANMRDEVTMCLRPDEMRIFTVDPANVFIFGATIPKTAFREYNVPLDTDITVDVRKLERVVKKLRGNFVTLEKVDPEKPKNLYGSVEGGDDRKRAVFTCVDATFAIPIEPDDRIPRIPKIEFKTSFEICYKELISDLEVIGAFGNNIVIADHVLYGDNVIVELRNKISNFVSPGYEQRSMFSIDILTGKHMKALGKLVKTCTVSINVDNPVRIDGNGEKSENYVMLCAPRVGDDSVIRAV